MAKKFGKFLLFTAAVGTAAAAAYYFVRKKDADMANIYDDDDYDDFSDDLDDTDASSRTYVSLNRDVADTSEESATSSNTVSEDSASDFTPLADQLAQNSDEEEETIEEFFDEEDSIDEEPPLSDN